VSTNVSETIDDVVNLAIRQGAPSAFGKLAEPVEGIVGLTVGGRIRLEPERRTSADT